MRPIYIVLGILCIVLCQIELIDLLGKFIDYNGDWSRYPSIKYMSKNWSIAMSVAFFLMFAWAGLDFLDKAGLLKKQKENV